ncbi:MAG: hypothetical protein H6Q61_932 [Firmicutes bacterium]|nr:hypothetical protein [Bacillota bacterium]
MKLDKQTLFRVAGAAFLLYLLIYYWSRISGFLFGLWVAAVPLLLGFLIAYLVNILMSYYENHYLMGSKVPFVNKSRRPVCMLLAFLSLILIVVFVVRLIVPELVSSVQLLGREIPVAWNAGMGWLQENVDPEVWTQIAGVVGGSNLDWNTIINKVANGLAMGFGGIMGTLAAFLTRTATAVVILLVAVIFSVYLLYGKERFAAQLDRVTRHYVRPVWYKRLIYVKEVFDHCFRRFIVGQCIEAVILGCLCVLGMYLFRFPYANMVGTLVGFTALIPVAGAYIGATVGAFMIFTISPIKALFFVLFLVILQQLEGNIIYPRVVGASIGLPGIWVLAAITVGGGILGVAGMLLGVPLAAALYQILKDDVNEGPMREQNLR